MEKNIKNKIPIWVSGLLLISVAGFLFAGFTVADVHLSKGIDDSFYKETSLDPSTFNEKQCVVYGGFSSKNLVFSQDSPDTSQKTLDIDIEEMRGQISYDSYYVSEHYQDSSSSYEVLTFSSLEDARNSFEHFEERDKEKLREGAYIREPTDVWGEERFAYTNSENNRYYRSFRIGKDIILIESSDKFKAEQLAQKLDERAC